MIRFVKSNKWEYENEKDDFGNDSYVRHYECKTYFMGVRICKRELHERVSRKERTKKEIGFK